MQEGLLSLMQMAKTSGALARHHSAGLPAVVVDTDPSMGGVTASWGSLGDLLIAEPGALLGFAGLRVAQQATTAKAPPNFQTAEFHLVAGHLDRVVVRRELKETIARYLAFCGARRVPGEDDGS
jgi:acetyl-CoA carboxylase carboxyl transferase subunit beta